MKVDPNLENTKCHAKQNYKRSKSATKSRWYREPERLECALKNPSLSKLLSIVDPMQLHFSITNGVEN